MQARSIESLEHCVNFSNCLADDQTRFDLEAETMQGDFSELHVSLQPRDLLRFIKRLRFYCTWRRFMRYTAEPGSGAIDRATFNRDFRQGHRRWRKSRNYFRETHTKRKFFFWPKFGGQFHEALRNWSALNLALVVAIWATDISPDNTTNSHTRRMCKKLFSSSEEVLTHFCSETSCEK